MLKIRVLLENTQARPDALTEHGLSLYIETDRHRILFDMGQSDKFAQNAELLSVRLEEADTASLSHGHYDHGGGLAHFLERNNRAPVYMNRYAFEPHYDGTERYIGLDTALSDHSRFVFVEDSFQIDDELELFSCNPYSRLRPVDSAGLTMKRGQAYVPEDFRHEQYLLIHDGSRRILVSGCSHKGILNIMSWFHPDVFIGGFHFMKVDLKQEGEQTLRQAAAVLNTYPTEFYTCHCTGEAQYAFLKELMGEKLHYLACGQELLSV